MKSYTDIAKIAMVSSIRKNLADAPGLANAVQ
jgi:hypothetical protein